MLENKMKKNVLLGKIKSKKKEIVFSFSVFLLIFLDQILKKITQDFNSFFIRPVINKGVSFGLLNNNSLFLSFISIFIFIFLIYFFIKKKKIIFNNNILYIVSILILSGTIGNLIDRIFMGYVRDFIYMYFFINNFADIYISIAFILLLIFNSSIDGLFKK